VNARNLTYAGPAQPSLTDGAARYTCDRTTLSFTLDGGDRHPDLPAVTWHYQRL
jgi:hypothetical protein